MRTKIAITLLLLAVGLAGCGRDTTSQAGAASPTGPTGPSRPSGGEPWGRTFLSTSVTENGQPKALVDGTRISLRFDGDRHHLGAQAGCNSMGGPVSFDGGRLVVDDLATTEMGCDPPRHAQDEWVARFLTSRPQYSYSGSTPEAPGSQGPTLTLDNGTVRMVLEDREAADPDRPLRGTKWVVDTVVDGETASSVPAGADAHVVFGDGDERDRFTGNTGCNGMGGNSVVREDPPTITFSEVITTKMACEDERMRLEQAVLATLTGDAGYRIEADVLHLDGPGRHGLRLQAATR